MLNEICAEDNIEFVRYNLPLKHLGQDGLHVRPAGAKHLLFTILGKVKRKCFPPVCSRPCISETSTSDRNLDSEEWPPLLSTCSTVKRSFGDKPAWASVVGSPNPRVEEEGKVTCQ